MLYSHIAQPDESHSEWRVQSTDEHNIGVARRAAAFADTFDFGDLGKVMGMHHSSLNLLQVTIVDYMTIVIMWR